MSYTKGQQVGQVGETIVAKWLERKGYAVIERNYKKCYGELDIIAKKGNTIHFIEVKTAERPFDPRDPFGPLVRVGTEKQKRFKRIIETYVASKHISDTPYRRSIRTAPAWQVDIALVYLDTLTATARVELLENVVLLEE